MSADACRPGETAIRIASHVEAGTGCSFCKATYWLCSDRVLRDVRDPEAWDGCCDDCQDGSGHETRYLSSVAGLIAEAVEQERAAWVARIEAIRDEMIGLQSAGAPLVGRQWVIRRLDYALSVSDSTTPGASTAALDAVKAEAGRAALRDAADVAISSVITGLETTRPDLVAIWLRARAAQTSGQS